MQIINKLMITSLLILFPFPIREDKIILNNFSIVYDDESFWLYFDEIDFSYERIYIYLNNTLLKAYEYNQKFFKVELYNSLLEENNTVKLDIITNSSNKTYDLFFKKEKNVNITDTGYFSFNNLITGNNNLINYGIDQFLKFKDFVCEFNTFNYKYIDLSLIGAMEYDSNYQLCEEIEIYFFNYKEIGLKDNIFKLEKKKDKLVFVNNEKWDSTLIKNGILYLPKNMVSQIIEMEVTFKSIYLSPIDVSFNLYINIESSLKDSLKITLSNQMINNYDVG